MPPTTNTSGYADDKEAWFRDVGAPGMERWAESSGWQPPSYVSSSANAAQTLNRVQPKAESGVPVSGRL
jgi:hypothetical protein